MVTRLKNNIFLNSFVVSIAGVFLLFAVGFTIFQYNREKDYKIEFMHTRLQMYNYQVMQALGNDGIQSDSLLQHFVKEHALENIRVTVIDEQGNVLSDSRETTRNPLNHLQRLEVQEALEKGSGYDIKRISESTRETYFYSATRFDHLIVRSAIPYSTELNHRLRADNGYLLFAFLFVALMCLVLFFNTRRIRHHIQYLRDFAVRAERGEMSDKEDEQLPKDELGDISHTITNLYKNLRHAEEDKLRLKRQLTQNAAHELKTPAASIHGYLESVIEHPDMPEEKRKHFMERCYAQSERMNKLLSDMMILDRLDDMEDRGDVSVKKDESRIVDVRGVIQNVQEDCALHLQEKGIELSLSLPDRILVPGNSDLLYSIFRNLVENAIAYATGANRLSIHCEEQDRSQNGRTIYYYEFMVSDNGVGVDESHLPHLFERFYRLDKGRSRQLGGTGLGLAIVKNAVAAHGGTVQAERTLGGGLTIRFTLRR